MDNPFERLVELISYRDCTPKKRHRQMRLSELQERLSYAIQADLENGVAWMNDHAADEFKKNYPMIWEMITLILDLESIYAGEIFRDTEGEEE